MPDDHSGYMPDIYDRMLGQLDGVPGVAKTNMTPLRVVPPLGVGGSHSYTVQTYRQKEIGDMIFVEWGSQDGLIRLVLPPAVANAIARQRDQLTAKVRRAASKAAAEDRKRRGIQPAFLKKKKTAKGSGKPADK